MLRNSGLMKVAAVTLLSCGVVLAGGEIQDRLIRFSTPGPDCYADGSPVADGECYALVWSPTGTPFSGFNADGTTISPNDRVILAAPLAKGGKCRDTVFQIPAQTYAELSGGEWAVCLVDTRTARGLPAGLTENRLRRVNRWGVVTSGVKIAPASASGLSLMAGLGKALPANTTGADAQGFCAGVISAVPETVKPPRITAFTLTDGVIRLSVTDTVPFLTYTLMSGPEPGALKADAAADAVDGNPEAEITIGTEAAGKSRFFRVKRAE